MRKVNGYGKWIGGLLTLTGIIAAIMFGAVRMLSSTSGAHVDHQLDPIKIQVNHNIDRLETHTGQIAIIAPVVAAASRNREELKEHEDEIDGLAVEMGKVSVKVDGLIRGQERMLNWIDSQ